MHSPIGLDIDGSIGLTVVMDQKTALINLATCLAQHQNVTHFAISMRASGKGDFFKRLMEGGDCRTTTARNLMNYFAVNWPEDLEWPEGVPRPEPSKTSA